MDKARTASLLLDHALPDVPFDGWTQTVLVRACAKAGLPESAWFRVFPAGPADAVDAFIARADHAMTEALAKLPLNEMKIRERITTAITLRLQALLPHREAVRRAVHFYLLPAHALRGMKTLYRTVDSIWYATGDQSTDFNFYTKRATLAAVYATTLQVWLDDESPGQQETREFLARRIENVMQFERFKQKLKRKN